MEKRNIFEGLEKVTRDDFNNLGTFPQQSFDTVVGSLLIPDMDFSGFEVVQSGTAEVTVGTGHLFYLGKVFFNDTENGTTVNLLSRLPAATKRIVAITVWGVEIDTDVEPRTFMTDVETRATEARATATQHWRWANIGAVSGTEGPDPQAPAVTADVQVVAWVTLDTTGVTAIELVPPVRTLRDEDNRLNEFDIWRIQIGSLLDTLRSDLLALAARIAGLAPFTIVRQMASDLAWLRDLSHLPATYTSYDVDHFLTEDKSDTLHVDWLARIEEGVRFPPAAGFDAQLGLLNPFEALVKQQNFLVLPTWTAASRIVNMGTDSELSISQYNYQTVDMVQKTMSRQVTRYGTPFTVCTNADFWQSGVYDWWNFTFNRGGEVFNVLDTAGFSADDIMLATHGIVRLQQVWTDTVQEPYWDRVVTTYSISGAVIAETFPVVQDGWMCEIDLLFSRIATTGGVDVLLVELTNGQPDPSKVISRSTLTAADLKVSTAKNRQPVKFLFQPTYLRKGRYGFVVITSGNHYIWCLSNKNLVSGTLFYSTDGAWFQGDLTKDIAFEMFFCKFTNNMSQVQLQPLTLTGGIAAIEINADTIVPDGTRLYYEIQVAGAWHALDNVDGGPGVQLNGLPPLLPFRAVFVGTDSIQPGLGVASNSRVTTWRPRADYKHISAIRTTPVGGSPHITADFRVEAWRGGPYHTILFRLLHGAGYTTVRSPDVLTSEPAPDDPINSIIYHCSWLGMGALTTFRFRIEGTTDNVLATYHVASRFDIDLPT